jgi:hypothetical protein
MLNALRESKERRLAPATQKILHRTGVQLRGWSTFVFYVIDKDFSTTSNILGDRLNA